MFTGIVEATGKTLRLEERGQGAQLALDIPAFGAELQIGESVAVNGCCLTVTSLDGQTAHFDLLGETLRCTNLGDLKDGSLVNLERAMPPDGRLSGHFVQGHIDCSSRVVALEEKTPDHRLEVELPGEFANLAAYKGSIAVDGISLTVAEATANSVVIWIIPHTFEVINLQNAKPGDRVNLEFDILAKYVDRQLSLREIG